MVGTATSSRGQLEKVVAAHGAAVLVLKPFFDAARVVAVEARHVQHGLGLLKGVQTNAAFARSPPPKRHLVELLGNVLGFRIVFVTALTASYLLVSDRY